MKTDSLPGTKTMMSSAIFCITAILLVACMAGQFYNFSILQHLKAKTPGIQAWYNPMREEFFAQFFLCLGIWISAYIINRHNVKFRTSGILLSVFGAATFCGLLLQGICMNEYYEEFYLGGFNADFEWTFSHAFLVINLLFCGSAIIFLILGFRNLRTFRGNSSQSSEYIFEVTQYIGVISGLIGIVFSYYAFQYLNYYGHKLSSAYISWIYMCCLIFIFPYLSMVIFWVAKLAFKKNTTLYDEKQKRDLSNAGLFTWLFSIPLMSLFMILNLDHIRSVTGIIVFPVYVFTTLLIFSASVLFNYKRV